MGFYPKPIKDTSNIRKGKTLRERRERNKKAAIALSKDQKRHKWFWEMVFMKFLKENNIKFVFQKPIWTPYWYVCADFYIPSKKIVIEINGPSHKAKRDKIRTERLIKSGKATKVIAVRNHDLKYHPEKTYKEVLKQLK